jgi:hypothetical protein
MKDQHSKQEIVMFKVFKSLGITGLIMIFVALGAMRLFFSESKAQSMERKPPVISDNEEFNQAMEECLDSVAVDEKGRPNRTAMDECMSAKGFTRPEGRPGDHGIKGPAAFMPPPYHIQDDENSEQDDEQ